GPGARPERPGGFFGSWLPSGRERFPFSRRLDGIHREGYPSRVKGRGQGPGLFDWARKHVGTSERDPEAAEERPPPKVLPSPESGRASDASQESTTSTPQCQAPSNSSRIASGEKAKARDILAAIRTLKQIEKEERPATEEERAVLARFSGFGS